MKYLIHTDGGSRGNPGPAALGFVIEDEHGKVIKEHGEYLGEKTNNEAEYQAVIHALKKLKSIIGKDTSKSAEVQIYADSELLVKQMNGEYKINDKNIQGWFVEIWNLRLDFGKVIFTHVFREQNKDADRMVNVALDKELSGKLEL